MDFKIDHLDHVAIRVKDIKLSIKWYIDVLGLKRMIFEEWGEYPVFLSAGLSGIALFPAVLDDEPLNSLGTLGKTNKIDHFAFSVSNENFIKAEKKYKALDIDYEFQDHYYYHSIYTKDPDGHTVELTTQIISSVD